MTTYYCLQCKDAGCPICYDRPARVERLVTEAFDFNTLTLRQLAIAGHFGMMRVKTPETAEFNNGGMTFHMREAKPSPELETDLAALMEKGVICKVLQPKGPGFTYHPLVPTMAAQHYVFSKMDDPSFRETLAFPMTVPV